MYCFVFVFYTRYLEIWEKYLSTFFSNYLLQPRQPQLYRGRWQKGKSQTLYLKEKHYYDYIPKKFITYYDVTFVVWGIFIDRNYKVQWSNLFYFCHIKRANIKIVQIMVWKMRKAEAVIIKNVIVERPVVKSRSYWYADNLSLRLIYSGRYAFYYQ